MLLVLDYSIIFVHNLKLNNMRKFTSDYFYGVIDNYIIMTETKPKSDYGFLVQVYDEFGYATITFTYGIEEGDSQEWWFRFVKGEPLIKLNKSIQESLEIICKYEKFL